MAAIDRAQQTRQHRRHQHRAPKNHTALFPSRHFASHPLPFVPLAIVHRCCRSDPCRFTLFWCVNSVYLYEYTSLTGDASLGSMRPLWSECPYPSSARFLLATMTSSLYPANSTPCKPSESCLNQCSPPIVPKLSKVDSSYGLNGNLSNNYNFYTCHLPQASPLPPKSAYNVSTY